MSSGIRHYRRLLPSGSPHIHQCMEADVLLNVSDYGRAAHQKLSKGVRDYYEGGPLDEITLRENTGAWERLKLYYHVLAGVGARDLNTTVLGQAVSMPILPR